MPGASGLLVACSFRRVSFPNSSSEPAETTSSASYCPSKNLCSSPKSGPTTFQWKRRVLGVQDVLVCQKGVEDPADARAFFFAYADVGFHECSSWSGSV